ncbi:MAG: DUF4040 domain-containing protein [Leptolyngbyaceae cyanobacterium CSU_1_4]|nr:DUF4040 domain-containing protein [Leptolyngbyaceae cyanobacterium CSU_1_4]
MEDSYIYAIVALLPLAAVMLTVQVNPYNALVIRGILGGVAALVYAVLGAADVALTEALVGTMLAITLYAVAVRSSLIMRVGVLKDECKDEWINEHRDECKHELIQADDLHPFAQLITHLSMIAKKYHLRLELIPYGDPQSLQQALMEKEVHITCIPNSCVERSHENEQLRPPDATPEYHTVTRIRRLYDILQTELTSLTPSSIPSPPPSPPSPITGVTYVMVQDLGEKH